VNVDVITESPTADTPSANPLDLLPLRQLLYQYQPGADSLA